MMESSKNYSFNFLQYSAEQSDSVLRFADRAHICAPTVAHLTCGHRSITCPPPLVHTLADSYLRKEEAVCLQGIPAAIRRQRCSVLQTKLYDCSFFKSVTK